MPASSSLALNVPLSPAEAGSTEAANAWIDGLPAALLAGFDLDYQPPSPAARAPLRSVWLPPSMPSSLPAQAAPQHLAPSKTAPAGAVVTPGQTREITA